MKPLSVGIEVRLPPFSFFSHPPPYALPVPTSENGRRVPSSDSISPPPPFRLSPQPDGWSRVFSLSFSYEEGLELGFPSKVSIFFLSDCSPSDTLRSFSFDSDIGGPSYKTNVGTLSFPPPFPLLAPFPSSECATALATTGYRERAFFDCARSGFYFLFHSPIFSFA